MKKKRERNSGTHFEQVPLELVKKIAEVDTANDAEKAGTDVVVEPASGKSKSKRRRERSRDRE